MKWQYEWYIDKNRPNKSSIKEMNALERKMITYIEWNTRKKWCMKAMLGKNLMQFSHPQEKKNKKK